MNLSHALKIRGFRMFQRFGIHIVGNHFYQPIPDTQRLPEHIWTRPSRLLGIDMNDAGQLSLLENFCTRFKIEFDQFPTEKPQTPAVYYLSNGLFEAVDAEILYSMVRHFKPKIVLEIGSGNSTLLSAQAILKNRDDTGHQSELTAVEPYPNEILKKGFPGLTRLVTSPAQDLGLSEFERLDENDILFIDSSHVLKVASDVQFLYLEVLPRLKSGVVIHFHDIFLPGHYPKRWIVDELRFWNEQYLLQAFLAFNQAFEVRWAGSYMNLKYPDRLEAAFSSYKRGQTAPGSFWVRKIA